MNKVYLWTNKINIINMAVYHECDTEKLADGLASILWEAMATTATDTLFADVAKELNIPANELLHAIRKVSAERCGSDYTGYWED